MRAALRLAVTDAVSIELVPQSTSFLFVAYANGVKIGAVGAKEVPPDISGVNSNYRRYVQTLAVTLGVPLRVFSIAGSRIDAGYRNHGVGSRLYLEVLREVSRRGGALVPHKAHAGAARTEAADRVWARMRRWPGVMSLNGNDALVIPGLLPARESA